LKISDQLLREIVGGASLPMERIGEDFEKTGESSDLFLERWCKSAAAENQAAFSRLLGFLKLSPDEARAISGPHVLSNEVKLPAWAVELCRIVDNIENVDHSKRVAKEDQEPLVFESIWAAVASVAEIKVSEQCRSNCFFQENLRTTHRFDLTTLLCSVGARVLYADFSGYRSGFVKGGSPSPLSTRILNQYIESVFSGRLLEILKEYPVLARIIGTVVLQWQKNTVDFFARLSQDEDELSRMCGARLEPKQIEIKTGISDRHKGGQRCVSLRFSNGKRCIYKPRSLQPEIFFSQCIKRFWSPDLPSPASLKFLNRESYGWEEYVEEQDCTEAREAEDYYRRGGALLFFAYLLGGTDFHCENLIAHKDYPVLIDLEGIAAHLPDECDLFELMGSSAVGKHYFAESVLRTALLSTRMIDSDQQWIDLGGFPATFTDRILETRTRWKNLDSDAITPEKRAVVVSSPRNQVKIKGNLVETLQYLPFLIEGFKKQYQYFTSSQLKGEFQHWLSEQPEFMSRFIYRDTAVYARMVEAMLVPSRMTSGEELFIALSGLCRVQALSGYEPGAEWRIILSEQRQLLQLDAPVFLTSFKQRAIFDDRERLAEQVFAVSAYEGIQHRLDQIKDVNLDQQLQLIELSYQSSTLPGQSTINKTSGPNDVGAPAEEQLCNILDHVLSLSVLSSSGERNWMGFAIDHNQDQRLCQPMLPRLYDGYTGPALLFALSGAALNQQRYIQASREVLQILHARCENDFFIRTLRREGIGAYTGLPSVVYTLFSVARSCNCQLTMDLCFKYADLLLPEDIEVSDKIDVFDGVSGAAMIYSALTQHHSLNRYQRLLEMCRKRLLEIDIKQAKETVYSGFAHGTSGIIAACARLGSALGDDVLREKALNFMQREEVLFDQASGGWRASFELNDSTVYNRWCHGAPGMCLARIEFLRESASTLAQDQLNCMIDSIKLLPDSPSLWNLCCGSAGLAEIAGLVQRHYPDCELERKQRSWLEHARSSSLSGAEHMSQCLDPGLFHGFSGIGYALVRTIDGSLPGVLLLE